jgi:tetratricopeptide (TPR) repeat protein
MRKIGPPKSGRGMIWYEYGNAAFKSRRMEWPIAPGAKRSSSDPRNAELIGMVGHQYEALRRPEKARACFLQAAAADPRGINPRISLAVLRKKTIVWRKPAPRSTNAWPSIRKDDQARYFNAVLDRREGHLQEAERGLRDLLASDPRHPFVRYAARYELAQVLDRTDRFDEAMVLLREAKEMVLALADAKLLMRGYDQSAESIRRFTASQPKNILDTWAKYFPLRKRESIPPLAFLGGHPRSGTTLLEKFSTPTPAWRRWTNRRRSWKSCSRSSTNPASFPARASMSCAATTSRLCGTTWGGRGGQNAD